ncbi:MAG TPA: hypothetical protein VE127_17595 [Solirubrobacteraceae bacterium]|nr:hypothetical protein [Solirubrobacteraceae bacterium]
MPARVLASLPGSTWRASLIVAHPRPVLVGGTLLRIRDPLVLVGGAIALSSAVLLRLVCAVSFVATALSLVKLAVQLLPGGSLCTRSPSGRMRLLRGFPLPGGMVASSQLRAPRRVLLGQTRAVVEHVRGPQEHRRQALRLRRSEPCACSPGFHALTDQ